MSTQFNFSSVNEFYAKKSILITGVTGLCGRILLYKSLLSIIDINKVYVLIRSKKNKTANERYEDVIAKSRGLFDEIDSERLSKVIPISGDLTEIGLGLSESDRNTLIENVSIVFHSAADVTFDAKLKGQLLINVGGTKEIIDLCRQLKQLDALIYLSTAYSNPLQTLVKEKIYRSFRNPIELLNIARNTTQELSNADYIGQYPNTYTFTKNLAETLVDTEFSKQPFPVAIVRPGIVLNSYNEPFGGWFPSVTSISGLILMNAVGLAKITPMKSHITFDLIPADTVANACIVAAYALPKPKDNAAKVPVYTCNSASLGALTFGKCAEIFVELGKQNPFLSTVRPPINPLGYSRLLPRRWLQFFQETCFAYFVDSLLFLFGKKTGVAIKVKVYQKMMAVVQPFVGRQWYFTNYNMLELHKCLTGSDKTTFNCDILAIDWKKYLTQLYFALGRLFLHETDDSMRKAKIVIKYLKIGYSVADHILLYFLWYIVCKITASLPIFISELNSVNILPQFINPLNVGYCAIIGSLSIKAIAFLRKLCVNKY